MAQVILFHQGYMIRQRGVAAPKKATMDRWLKQIWTSFSADLTELGYDPKQVPMISKQIIEPDRMRISVACGAIAFYVDRTQDALVR